MKPVTEDEAAALIAHHQAQARARAEIRERNSIGEFWFEWAWAVFNFACLAVAAYGLVKFIKWAWES